MKHLTGCFVALCLALAGAPAAHAAHGYDVFRPGTPLRDRCPGACSVAYRVGTGAPVMYVAGQHGRDWLGVEVLRRQFAEAIANPVSGTAMWFVPVADPDAYDATFASKAARLAQNVDLDSNWDETTEPAVAALDDLLHDVDPAYLIDYQSGGGRILYPEAWQIATPATDAPAFEALAGD